MSDHIKRKGNVRVQASWDKSADLNKGGFLAHRSNMESADETEIRGTVDFRTVCKRHPTDGEETPFNRGEDQGRTEWPSGRIQQRQSHTR